MNVLIHSFTPLLPLLILAGIGFIFYCYFLPDNFKRNKAYIILPVLLCITYAWRLVFNTESGRYYILLNIPCILFAAIGTIYLKKICKALLPILQKYYIPLILLGFGIACVAIILSPPSSKEYLRDIPKIIQQDITVNKYLNPVYIDSNSNSSRIDYYSTGNFKVVANYDFRKKNKQAIKTFCNILPELELKHDVIYIAAREKIAGDMLKQIEKKLKRELYYKLLKEYKQKRGKTVNLYVQKTPATTFGKVGFSKKCNEGILLNSEFKTGILKNTHMKNVLAELREKKIKCFDKDYRWEIPGWYLHPGHGWQAQHPDNFAYAVTKNNKSYLHLGGIFLSVLNYKQWSADQESEGIINLYGTPGSIFAVYIYVADQKTNKHLKTWRYKKFCLLDNQMRYYKFKIPPRKGRNYRFVFCLIKGDVFIDTINVYANIAEQN
jgi:hypothetical protein